MKNVLVLKRMSMRDHTDDSWAAMFDCADAERRCYKVMDQHGRLHEDRLTYSEAISLILLLNQYADEAVEQEACV